MTFLAPQAIALTHSDRPRSAASLPRLSSPKYEDTLSCSSKAWASTQLGATRLAPEIAPVFAMKRVTYCYDIRTETATVLFAPR